jgi:endonuclease/exonuclease/phosphatase family metal-dependent hydrolase
MDLAEPTDAVLLAADFNAVPDAPSRQLLEATGLVSTADRIKSSPRAPTYQFYGIRVRSLDDILVDRRWRVLERRVIDRKPQNTFPSDHFGVMADLMLADATSDVPVHKSRVASAQNIIEPRAWYEGDFGR